MKYILTVIDKAVIGQIDVNFNQKTEENMYEDSKWSDIDHSNLILWELNAVNRSEAIKETKEFANNLELDLSMFEIVEVKDLSVIKLK